MTYSTLNVSEQQMAAGRWKSVQWSKKRCTLRDFAWFGYSIASALITAADIDAPPRLCVNDSEVASLILGLEDEQAETVYL